jgi:hypothetical protein
MKQADLDLHFILNGKNREINREFFEFDAEIAEFCPNSAILLQEQGINREFPLFSLKPCKCKGLPRN